MMRLNWKVFQPGCLLFTSQGRKEGPPLSTGERVRRLEEERPAEVVPEEDRGLPGNRAAFRPGSGSRSTGWGVAARGASP